MDQCLTTTTSNLCLSFAFLFCEDSILFHHPVEAIVLHVRCCWREREGVVARRAHHDDAEEEEEELYTAAQYQLVRILIIRGERKRERERERDWNNDILSGTLCLAITIMLDSIQRSCQ